MGYFDWTANEKRQIMDSLKALPPVERVKVRDIVKDMSASDALEHLAEVSKEQTANYPLKAPTSQNKPLKPSKGINLPIQTDKGQNKPLKASTIPNKPVKSAKGTKAHAGAKQAAEKPIKASNDHPQILPRVDGDIIADTFDIDDIKHNIDAFIRAWCASNDIDDLRKAEQPIFNALCSDIGNTIFKPSAVLKDKSTYDNGSAAYTNNNQYDIDKVIAIIDICNYYCNICNKVFTIHAAAAFCGVSKDFFYDNREKLTRLGCDLWKNSELSLADSIVSGKRNPTGALAALNHWHGWSGASTNRTEVRETTVVYPVLVDINKNKSDLISDNSNNNP